MHRRRFGLLLLALLVFVAKGLCALQAYWQRQSQRELTAVNELQRLGAAIQWGWRPDARIQQRQLGYDRAPSWFVPGDGFVVGVYLSFCRENQLDQKLECLQSLRELRCLALGDCVVTDAALAHLRNRRRLEWLDLHNTSISDDGLRQLASDAPLVSLNLFNTPVTDASVPLLVNFRRLKWLNLGGTRISSSGQAALRERLPGVHIETDFDDSLLRRPWNLGDDFALRHD
jgi:hypothetical protein